MTPAFKQGALNAVSCLLVAVVLLAVTAPAAAAAGGPQPEPAHAPAATISESAAGAIDRLNRLAGAPPVQTTRIFDRYGNLLYELSDDGRRTIVPLDRVPQALIHATIATEDKNFFRHHPTPWVYLA